MTQCARIYGREGDTLDLLIADGPAGNMPDHPNTVGYETDRACWFASGQTDPAGINRVTPLWGNAFPAIALAPSGTTSDPYKSNVQSTILAIPAFDQDPSDPTSWRSDTGVLPQKVATPGGRPIAGGTPLVVLPFSVTTEQQMAAFAASSDLIAVWKGGAAVGKYGTLEYDVKADGSLDDERRARLQTADRIWRFPVGGLLPFGAVPGADKKPFPPSSGIAWQLGLDIDSQAGYGAVVDQVGGAPPAPQPDPKNPADPGSATGTQEKPGGGAGSGTVAKPGGGPGTTSTTSVIGLTGRRAFGGHSVGLVLDKHRIAVTPDQEPVNCDHWNVLQPIDGDGFDAPFKTAGVWEPAGDGGPIIREVFCRYDPNDTHPFLGGTREGLRKWEVRVPVDVTPKREKTPGHDGGKFGGKDAGKDGGRDKSSGKDAGKDGSKDAAEGFGDGAKVGGDGVKVIADNSFPRRPVEIPNPGTATGITPTPPPFEVPPPPLPPGLFGGEGPFGPPPPTIEAPPLPAGLFGGVAPDDGFSFGGGILYNSGAAQTQGETPQDGPSTIAEDRGYARTPLEFATPALLGRPVALRGTDLRGRTNTLTDDQQEVYDSATPISGILAAVCNQATGSFVPRAPGNARGGEGQFFGGTTDAGGFAVLPATVDVRAWQEGWALPADLPETTLFAGTLGSQFAVADITLSGLPKDGYTWGRGGNTTCSIDWVDSNGIAGGPTELPPAIYLDSGASPIDPPPTFKAWGGQVVAVWNTTAGQAPSGSVFVADGTNTGPGGTWQSVAGANAAGIFGDGSDGAAVFDGTNTFGFASKSGATYTLLRDVFLTNLTVSGGANPILNTGSYRVFVQGTTTIGATSSINNNGNQGSGATAGGPVGTGTVAGSFGGGNGATTNAAGTNGTSATDTLGGAGGNGGSATQDSVVPPAPATGGTTTAISNTKGSVRAIPQLVLGEANGFGGKTYVTGGAGGGGGTLQIDGTGTGHGGGGGGGGGVLVLATRILINNGVISANGANGYPAFTGVANAGAGGGGGGGGGTVLLVYGSAGSTLGTVQASGGTGGAGASTGAASGNTGQNGSAGTVVKIAL